MSADRVRCSQTTSEPFKSDREAHRDRVYPRSIASPSHRAPTPTRIELPSAVDLAVRMASVPPSVRALVSRLPGPITVCASIPADVALIPIAARQLLKLFTTSDRFELGDLEIGAAETKVELSAFGRTHVITESALGSELDALMRNALLALCSSAELVGIVERFSAQSARLEALHMLTTLMLQSSDLDRALYVMLSGITSGHGLGMNRAALFLHDESARQYIGSKAIGPHDAEEAHRIWEAIEVEGKTMEHLVDDYASENLDGRFQHFVETLTLVRTDQVDDEIAMAEAATGPVCFTRRAAKNPSLAALGVKDEYVVLVIQLRGTILGLLVCDNVYGRDPISHDKLEALASFIGQSALVWQNLSLLRRVETLARHDGLTGLLNRRALEARMGEERARAARTDRPLSVLVIDVDHFKRVNDVLGHAAGDDALRAIGLLLQSSLRAGDHAGRFGGDEFVVLLPEATEAEAAIVALRIGQTAARANVSLSIGGATWPSSVETLDELLPSADASLYEAKRGGRARGRLANGLAIGPFIDE